CGGRVARFVRRLALGRPLPLADADPPRDRHPRPGLQRPRGRRLRPVPCTAGVKAGPDRGAALRVIAASSALPRAAATGGLSCTSLATDGLFSRGQVMPPPTIR